MMPNSKALRVALIGYRGTGKTTVGRLLADRLGLPFVDADQAIESRAGCTVAATFAEQGEEAFRDLEERTLRELSERPQILLATGGGIVLRESNREVLRRFDRVILLTADPQTIERRLRADTNFRPALTARGTLGEIAELLEARGPLYREAAHAIIATDGKTPEQVVEQIVDR